jgi:hypothetical protein
MCQNVVVITRDGQNDIHTGGGELGPPVRSQLQLQNKGGATYGLERETKEDALYRSHN